MIKIITYFKTFDSFIKLLFIIKRRIYVTYLRYTGKVLKNFREKKFENKIDNSLKLQEIKDILSLSINLDLNDNEFNSIKKKAELILMNTYNLLGSGNKKLEIIDWHTDFKSGYRWNPGIFYLNYVQEKIDSNADVKVPRELSRCHHFLQCGIAFNITKDNKYAEIILKQLNSWIDNNPIMYSINWGCTMDVSIRVVNWIWAISLIENYKDFDKKIKHKIYVNLYKHGWFIYNNLEKNEFCNHNHYLADLAGQIHLGLLFKNTQEGEKWLNVGMSELFKEIRWQILPSGMSYERSTHYNRLVLELILTPILLLKRNGYEIPQDIWCRLEKMFEFLMYTLKPNGESPIIGDQDNGRLLPFGNDELNNFEYLLSVGAALYKRGDFKAHGNGYNVYCSLLCPECSREEFDNIKINSIKLKSKGFIDVGFYVMRNNKDYLLFNVSGKGLYPEIASTTHTHSDLLSFELCINGKTVLTDSGSYIYTGDAEQRMLFRSTAMHNTITVDSLSQNELNKENLWDFERNALPKVLLWESNDEYDKIIASHNGYERLLKPIIHRRTVFFNKIKTFWEITDEMLGSGNHLFELNYIFDNDIDFEIIDENLVKVKWDEENTIISFISEKKLELSKVISFISKSYGVKQECKKLLVTVKTTAPFTIKTVINKK